MTDVSSAHCRELMIANRLAMVVKNGEIDQKFCKQKKIHTFYFLLPKYTNVRARQRTYVEVLRRDRDQLY